MKSCRFVPFVVVFASVAITEADISADYYFGDRLRSGFLTMGCSHKVLKEACELKCGPKHTCLMGKCFCVMNGYISNEESYEVNASIEDNQNTVADFEDYTKITPAAHSLQSFFKIYKHKPTLRHHIAHFCPNLKVAQECIRDCMAVGKPAFCGKDHVCYCGHKYDYPINNTNTDPVDVYAQFKDLYTKYFGPRALLVVSMIKMTDA